MYNGLVRRNPNDGMASVIPSLASSWEIAPDAQELHVHPGGETLTSTTDRLSLRRT